MAKSIKNKLRFLDKYSSGTKAKDACLCKDGSLLPEGITRVSEEAIVSDRLIGVNFDPKHPASPSNKVTIAAFDFDGTCISGSSPKKLVGVLGRKGRISPYKLFRIGLWGLAYKLNLPKDAEGVRQRVFSAFAGLPAEKVNKFLCTFFNDKVAHMYRQDADACMLAHLEDGHVVILISASFEPIIAAAMLEHPIQYALASRMQIDAEGTYTGKVEGLTTEGPDKIIALREFCDKYFGKDCWEIGWAYADHFSDLTLLEAATHPCAVTPDNLLEETAEERGWKILNWK